MATKKTIDTIPIQQQNTNKKQSSPKASKEINGPRGLEPTRYGDWENKGRCYDF